MERRITQTLLATLLAFTICAAPFVDAKKAEAIVPVAAAGGAAALAAELGITTEALMTGLVAITAAGTGLYLMSSSDGASTLSDAEWRHLWGTGADVSNPGYSSNWGEDYEKYKLGNGKSWDELTNDEKENWDTPAQYVQSQWLGYLLGLDLIQETQNGGFEPTPEPDPNNDPEGASQWQSARNVLTVLGVSGGAVALNEGVGWLGEAAGNALHDLIFGTAQDGGLGLLYSATTSVNGIQVNYQINDVTATRTQNNKDFILNSTNWPFRLGGIRNTIYAPLNGQTSTINFELYSNRYYRKSLDYVCMELNLPGLSTYNSEASLIGTPRDYWASSGAVGYLNAIYSGTYVFPNGATYDNGEWTTDTGVSQTVSYGQMTDTPQQLANTVTSNDAWKDYLDTATPQAEEGKKKAIVVPVDWDEVESYDDIVKEIVEEDITPIPDDEPIPSPDPDPDPDPDPNPNPGPPDVDFENDFTERVNALLSNPFDQLFPFCLIGDFRDFFFIIMGQPELAQRVDTSNFRKSRSNTPLEDLNGVHTLTIPLNDWGIQDVDDIEFDLDPIHDVGRYVRVVITIALIMGIVMYSFSFFLKRGA